MLSKCATKCTQPFLRCRHSNCTFIIFIMAREYASELSPTTRGRIMGFVRVHMPYRHIQKLLKEEYNRNIALDTISCLKKHQETYRNLQNLPRSGCSKSITLPDEKHTISLIDREKALNAANLCCGYYNHLSVSTIRCALKCEGLHAYRLQKVPHLNKFQRCAQKVWAKGFLNWDFNI